ncbi:putative holin [Ralstonia phage phiRSP]|uniref:Putative holin n=1 Tax=Ralstonia phage phiRSP TaxID=2201420 RepID=A0A345ANS4_9CAUD|nr:holin [Ralstonia phage phiRSP]AXF38213.1 putative holin [Ralstonia phage phiRSP]
MRPFMKGRATMDERGTTVDAAIAAAGSKATYAGAGGTVFGWMTSSEFSVICGIVLGVIGLVVNLVFKIREDRRQQGEHEARMREIRGERP